MRAASQAGRHPHRGSGLQDARPLARGRVGEEDVERRTDGIRRTARYAGVPQKYSSNDRRTMDSASKGPLLAMAADGASYKPATVVKSDGAARV